MACGTPVVTYDLEIIHGIIKNNKNGILVPEEESLETGIEKALKLKKEDILEGIEKYNWQNYQEKFIKSQVFINYDDVDF